MTMRLVLKVALGLVIMFALYYVVFEMTWSTSGGHG